MYRKSSIGVSPLVVDKIQSSLRITRRRLILTYVSFIIQHTQLLTTTVLKLVAMQRDRATDRFISFYFSSSLFYNLLCV